MNPKLLLRVTAPALLIGLILLGACLAGAWYINRLQTKMAGLLSRNVRSLQAAQELEIRVRRLRHHTLLYLVDPEPELLKSVQADHNHIEDDLNVAKETATTDDQKNCVARIEAQYQQYKLEQADLREEPHAKTSADLKKLVDFHPLTRVVEPCQELVSLNRAEMKRVADESADASSQGTLALVLLGLAGPFGGLVMGYGVARGLQRSIYRLSVRVQDMAQHLDRDVGSVNVVASGDLQDLDQQMRHIVRRVEEVGERLQQHQRDMMRAEQLAAVGQLAAGVAHEVRNPLTGIKMLVESALQSGNRKPLNLEDLQVIHREVARLEKTVQEFLHFARLPTPQCSTCDLRAVVREAVELVGGRARQQGVTLAVRTPDQPVDVFIDRGQLDTVLVNLFINALDAMPQGGRLEVEVEHTADAGARVTVADTGAGIPPQVASRLFTPFTTTKPTGTGLGLSISGRILQEHRGSLSAGNRPEGGARFVLTLPPPPEVVHADAAGR
jgi:two-component system, NtrC family, sensor histidine kinase HydH